ncbi:MAG: RDD family protein [Fibrobacter sp.]|nr:RDD family protein [Fibrobacter sp.]
MSWFYIDESITEGERRQGPYTLDEIFGFVQAKKITDETLVWHSGEENWKPWKDTLEAKTHASREEALQDAIEQLLKQTQAGKHYAGFFVRLVAYIIDNAIVGLFGGIVLLIMTKMHYLDLEKLQGLAAAFLDDPTSTEAMNNFFNAPGMWWFMLICSILQAIYFIFFTGKFSATPGKMLFKIRIESAQGEKMTWGLSCVRYMGSIFTQFTLTLYGLGYLIVCIDPKRRALHDWIARTRVVYKD